MKHEVPEPGRHEPCDTVREKRLCEQCFGAEGFPVLFSRLRLCTRCCRNHLERIESEYELFEYEKRVRRNDQFLRGVGVWVSVVCAAIVGFACAILSR